MYIDTHTHIMDEAYDPATLVAGLAAEGVAWVNAVGSDPATSRQAAELAARFPNVYAVVGVHPEAAADYNAEIEDELAALCRSPKVVAVGEIGLDYHYDYPKDAQAAAFCRQLELAERINLPVVLHVREAYGDALEILKSYAGKFRGVLHCYSGSAEMLSDFLALGLYVSFSGSVTFKNNKKADACIRAVPLSRVLTETDCPYLAPQACRGQLNRPAYVRYVAEKLAQTYGIGVDELNSAVAENAERLFGIPRSMA